MDKPSDLIEGAILSGRYEESTSVQGTWYRLVDKKADRVYCPLQVVLKELGEEEVAYGYISKVAERLGLPHGLTRQVIVGADVHGSNGIDILRQGGF